MEIKYRFWMTKLNEYFSWERIMRHCPEQLYDYLSETRESVLVREQYTGLKDKNGKEIYVGDIIAMPFSGTNFKIEYRKMEDIGCNGGEYSFYITGFMPVRMDGTVDSWGSCEIAYSSLVEGDVEVVGNIHEREEN